MYEEITRWLDPSAREADKTALVKWHDYKYTTEQCMMAVVKNNHMPKKIDLSLFESWIRSLGWRRIG